MACGPVLAGAPASGAGHDLVLAIAPGARRPGPGDPSASGGQGAPAAEDLANPRALLRDYGIRPNKRLGQHFLVSRDHLRRIVAAAEIAPSDVVLEVGPGLGVLTVALARLAGRVVAVEIDPRMRAVLADVVASQDNVEVVAADVLAVDPAELAGVAGGDAGDEMGRRRGYLLVANLPYYITSAVLRHVLEAPIKPERAVVTIQREVADRILAEPGDWSVLTAAVRFFAAPSLVTGVPAEAFHPPPKVESAVLRLDVRSGPPVKVPSEAAFFRVMKAGFRLRRKQLKNSLAAGLGCDRAAADRLLVAAGIDPERRPQTLNLEEWAAVATEWALHGPAEGEAAEE